MKTFDLSSRLLSQAIWTRVFEQSASLHLAQGADCFARLGQLDALRASAQYNTGSISTSTQWALLALAHYLAPTVVAEVGTFIGKSTMSLAMGMDAAGVLGEIHTCDKSNSMLLPELTRSKVVQYPGTGSTEMFKDLAADGYAGRVELVHVDGRLQNEDLALLTSLSTSDAVVALDDFEGTEKGAGNALALRASERFRRHVLVFPPSEALLRHFGFWDHSSTALLVPSTSIKLTPQ